MVALAGSSTRTRRRPAVASRLLTRVGSTGVLTWKVAAVPAVIAKVSRTVNVRLPKVNWRCQEVTAVLSQKAGVRLALAVKAPPLPGVTAMVEILVLDSH